MSSITMMSLPEQWQKRLKRLWTSMVMSLRLGKQYLVLGFLMS
ncbi:hypothetical protein OH492_19265 [Vibrio chagasii]|nr:hypothetical protein [Vibrio chagasii]